LVTFAASLIGGRFSFIDGGSRSRRGARSFIGRAQSFVDEARSFIDGAWSSAFEAKTWIDRGSASEPER